MFVIRPQCFIDFIYLMRLIADDNKKIIAELEAERNKNADIQSNLNLFPLFQILICLYKT